MSDGYCCYADKMLASSNRDFRHVDAIALSIFRPKTRRSMALVSVNTLGIRFILVIWIIVRKFLLGVPHEVA